MLSSTLKQLVLNMFFTYNRSDVGSAIQVTIPRENCDRSEVIWTLKRDGVNLIDKRNGL